MATPPKVSVIVPSYNHASYLAQRLDSILAQTFQDFELIFLDDASPDHTREVFDRYAQNPRIRAVFNEQNSGNVFKQWNRGLGMARGEYVWIAESDDYADPEFLATLVATLEAQPEVGVAYCESRKVDPAGEPLGLASEWYGATYRTDRWRASFVAEGTDEARDYALAGSPIANASCALFRRNLAIAAGGATEDLRLTGDWLFWVTLFGSAKVAFESRPLNFNRQHEGSVSSHSVRSGVDLEEFYRMANHVRSRFSPAPGLVERTRGMLFDRWLWRSLRRDSEINWRQQRRIHAEASTFDPGIGFRLLVRGLQARLGSLGRKLRLGGARPK
jgi:glycosyltransferase involved in cell wall biosynthesis